jgi:ATP-dependent Lon protease
MDAMRQSQHNVIGIVYTDKKDLDELTWEDFNRMGTACRVHQVDKVEDKFHVVVAGEQRFRIADWLSRDRPYRARVRYFPEKSAAASPEIKAYVTAIINTIKELLPLNPLYGEELKLFMQNFQPDDPSRLADFAASLTTSDAPELQQVLETIELRPRLEKVLVLLKRELEIAKAQMEIRKHV